MADAILYDVTSVHDSYRQFVVMTPTDAVMTQAPEHEIEPEPLPEELARVGEARCECYRCERKAVYGISSYDGWEVDYEHVCEYHFAKDREYFMELPDCTITRCDTGEVIYRHG